MPHIELDPSLPGITGLFAYRPQTAAPLGELADVLLRGPNSLSVGERELIGAVVSRGNDCEFCAASHAAVAAAALDGGQPVVDAACQSIDAAPVSDKMKALLRLASAVRESGRAVTDEQIAAARTAGATEVEIHDAVLIAAFFCMVNRYVDGLATPLPDDPVVYQPMARRLLDTGYADSTRNPGRAPDES